MENPPVHLILGPDSFKMIMDKRENKLYGDYEVRTALL